MTRRRIAPILATAIGLAAGCGARSTNRSPTPDQDPGRFARAVREANDVRRENQEAESRFFRGLGRLPPDLPEEGSPAPVPAPQAPELARTRTGEGNP